MCLKKALAILKQLTQCIISDQLALHHKPILTNTLDSGHDPKIH